MAESHFIDLNQNDTLQDVIRKMNRNMRSMMYANATKLKNADRQSYATLEDEIHSLELSLLRIAGELNDRIDTAYTRLTPPVGTIMICPNDPSSTYVGTTWVRIAEGVSFITSGNTYTEGTEWSRQGWSSTLVSGDQYIAVAAWKRTA